MISMSHGCGELVDKLFGAAATMTASHSPRKRSTPNIFRPVSQVQIYSSGLQVQSQYHQQQMFHQQQQLVRHRRLPGVGQAMTPGRKVPGCASQTGQASSDTLRRPKVKVKVISQGGVVCKMQDEHCLGGGGDAAGSNMVTMLPITPPATPRTRTVKIVDSVNNSISNNTKPINDACHQMQALVL